MLIRYCSDLHTEFSDFDMPFDYNGEDVLVLAGDITVKNRNDWVLKQAEVFPNIVLVDGNHEYYGGRIDKVQRINHEQFSNHSNIHYGNNTSVTIDGVTFHLTTLWTDMNKGCPMTVSVVGSSMNDYRQIQYYNTLNGAYYKFGPRDAMREHMVAKQYLLDNVKEGDVVVTHMAPTFLSIHDDYKHDRYMNGGYVSDLSELILDTKPALWINGHIHNTTCYKVGDTIVTSNPRGYVGVEENPDFDLYATVEI